MNVDHRERALASKDGPNSVIRDVASTIKETAYRSVESRISRPHHPCRIALLDAQGTIIAVNQDWKALAEETGTPLNRVGPPVNYLEVCGQGSRSSAASQKAFNGVRDVLQGRTSSFTMDYAADTPAGLAYFRMNVAPISYGNARVAIGHTNITDLQLSKEKDYKRLQQFARRLINAQEEERQRIAREIHDDLGNRIALMSLSVREVMKQASQGNTSLTISKLSGVVDGLADLSTVLRNLSHWLHPAVLRCLGIPAALRMLQEGFHETHGIQMDVVVPPNMPRLSDEVELCIFRITQECIQNVSKHSGADKVRIVLEYTHRWVRLTVSDTGRGFIRSEAATHNGGLGLQSMEERALSIRGRLTVKTAPGAGTQIRLTIPVHDSVIAAHS